MNDQELDQAIARIALVTDDEIAEWIGLADHDSALATLMAAPDTPDRHDVVVNKSALIERMASRSRWKAIGAVAGAAAAAVVAIVFVGAGIGEEGDGSRAWAAPLVAFAEGSPLLLIVHDSWSITRAHDDGTFGEMTFSNANDQADLRWQPASGITLGEERFSTGVNRGQYETPAGYVTVVEIPVSEGDAATAPSTVPAAPAMVPKPVRFNAHWTSDDQAVELDATVSTLNDFVDLLNRLEPVDVDTWLGGMPPSVIASIDQPAAVASLLAGVSVPAGFDAGTLGPTADITDRYQLVARVASAVACSWLDAWFTATENGDSAAADTAAAGLATSREWPMLLETQSQGGLADQVWQWADAINGGPGIITGAGPMPPARELAVGGLGCQMA